MFHQSLAVGAGLAQGGSVQAVWPVFELMAARLGMGDGAADAFAPSPAWDAGLVDVNARAWHCMEGRD